MKTSTLQAFIVLIVLSFILPSPSHAQLEEPFSIPDEVKGQKRMDLSHQRKALNDQRLDLEKKIGQHDNKCSHVPASNKTLNEECRSMMTQLLENIKKYRNKLDAFDKEVKAAVAKAKSTTQGLLQPHFSRGSKDSAPVDLRFMGLDEPLVVHPEAVKRTTRKESSGFKKRGLRIKEVPLPPEIRDKWKTADPFGGTAFGPTKTADLILDALKAGNGDIKASVEYLNNRVLKEGSDYLGKDALSYLEGLYAGAKDTGQDRLQREQDIISKNILLMVSSGGKIWPFPKNPGPDARGKNPLHWRTKRDNMVREAVQAGKNDYDKSLDYLSEKMKKNSGLPSAAIDAYYYLIGLKAYPDFQKKLRAGAEQ